jgi:large subunit ribosomal protein L21
MYAVIRTGGKQYKVAVDENVQVERLPGEKGDVVELNDVLLLSDDSGDLKTGAAAAGAKVTAKIVRQFRDEKIIVFKKRRRTNYRRKQGHRQDLTELRVVAIQ